MPIKGLEKGDGVWEKGKEPFLKKVFPSSPRLPYQPLSGTKQKNKERSNFFWIALWYFVSFDEYFQSLQSLQ